MRCSWAVAPAADDDEQVHEVDEAAAVEVMNRARRVPVREDDEEIVDAAVAVRVDVAGASDGVLVGHRDLRFDLMPNRDERRGTYIVDGINFAVPYELAKRVMEDIITNGKVTRGQLGFVGEELRGRPGIEVKAVAQNSPAAIAGLQPGDIIMAIDGIRLESASKTLDMIAETQPGTVLEMEISRNARTITMQVTVAELMVPQ